MAKNQQSTMVNRVKLASLVLRVGLIVVFLYAAYGSLTDPNDWAAYLPPFTAHLMSATTLLKFFAGFELLLVIWLASGKFIRYAAALSALTMMGIIASTPSLFAVTFRDLAIAAAAVALAILSD